MGLAALGPRTVRLLLLPHLADCLAHLQPLLGSQARDRQPDALLKHQLYCL